MDIASISAAISAVSGTTKLIGSVIDGRDSVKLNELKIAMNDHLLQLSTAALAINEKLIATQKENGELQEEISKLREQIADQSHYQLHTFPTGTHAFKDSRMEPTDRDVYFCAACMAEGKKAILQPQGLVLKCPKLHPDILISIPTPLPAQIIRKNRF
ncbi:hypothetical protein [Advenella sp. FME57]|uniref:hypothetical protein n=1 Tax=Advenella sp. FME57 TaxID=2742604 RepID=UPI001866E511|nr:hypothetical protein [Advenella sp. FME57]